MPIHSATAAEHLGKVPTEPYLWHFTSPQGLIGIMENREIWATATPYLNDTSEMQELVRRLEHAALSRRADMVLDSHLQRATAFCLDAILDTLQHGADWDAIEFSYVASLCENGNALSQWRSYCPPTGGFAVRFDVHPLMDRATAKGFEFTQCVYDPEVQQRICEEIIDSFLAETVPEVPVDLTAAYEDTPIPPGHISVQVADLHECLSRFAPLFKHQAFAEEREWRVVARRKTTAEEIRFRAGKGTVIPYIPVPLAPKLPEEWRHVGIRVGPCADPEAACRAALNLLWAKATTVVGGKVDTSKIPYRPTT